MSKHELFSRRYDVSSQQVLEALQRALASMPNTTLQRLDDTGQAVEFRTSLTLTSWGENMLARVESAGEAGSLLRVSGEPRVGVLSTAWGEEMHATQIEQQLFTAVDTALNETNQTGTAGSVSPKTARDIMSTDVKVIDMDDSA